LRCAAGSLPLSQQLFRIQVEQRVFHALQRSTSVVTVVMAVMFCTPPRRPEGCETKRDRWRANFPSPHVKGVRLASSDGHASGHGVLQPAGMACGLGSTTWRCYWALFGGAPSGPGSNPTTLKQRRDAGAPTTYAALHQQIAGATLVNPIPPGTGIKMRKKPL
jgi:hypothetical protein